MKKEICKTEREQKVWENGFKRGFDYGKKETAKQIFEEIEKLKLGYTRRNVYFNKEKMEELKKKCLK